MMVERRSAWRRLKPSSRCIYRRVGEKNNVIAGNDVTIQGAGSGLAGCASGPHRRASRDVCCCNPTISRERLPRLRRRRLGDTCCVVRPSPEIDELFRLSDDHGEGSDEKTGGQAARNGYMSAIRSLSRMRCSIYRPGAHGDEPPAGRAEINAQVSWQYIRRSGDSQLGNLVKGRDGNAEAARDWCRAEETRPGSVARCRIVRRGRQAQSPVSVAEAVSGLCMDCGTQGDTERYQVGDRSRDGHLLQGISVTVGIREMRRSRRVQSKVPSSPGLRKRLIRLLFDPFFSSSFPS